RGGQTRGVAPGAAGRVERTPAGRPVEEAPDDGLLDVDQGVAGSVVRGCPERIARPRSQLRCGHGLPARIAGGEESPKLLDPLPGPMTGTAEGVPAEGEAREADDEVPAADAVWRHPPRVWPWQRSALTPGQRSSSYLQ